MYDVSASGVQIYTFAGSDQADNNIVRNSRIHDITRTGDLDQVWGILVTGANNQIYNNVLYGISVGNANSNLGGLIIANSGNKLWNNTVYNVRNTGILVSSLASNTEVKNNIVYASTGSNLIVAGTVHAVLII